MTGKPSLADEVEALTPLGLEGLREVWRNRYGAPPKLRSAALLRHCLAWRLQAEALGGLDRDTQRQLKRSQRLQPEGLALGVGTTLQREWQGQIVQVTVEEVSVPISIELARQITSRRRATPAPSTRPRAGPVLEQPRAADAMTGTANAHRRSLRGHLRTEALASDGNTHTRVSPENCSCQRRRNVPSRGLMPETAGCREGR